MGNITKVTDIFFPLKDTSNGFYKDKFDLDYNYTVYGAGENNDELKIVDRDWVGSMFTIGLDSMPSEYKTHVLKSSGHFKFQDATIGGCIACNPLPQFTRTCDIRCDDFVFPYFISNGSSGEAPIMRIADGNNDEQIAAYHYTTVTPHTGMGRFYSEALHDGAQFVYMQFGLPEFNGLFDWLRNSVTYTESVMANKGRQPTMYQAVDTVLDILTWIAMPAFSVIALVVKKGWELLTGNTPFNYYYMKPAMHVYWAAVNDMVNHIATAMGLLHPMAQPDAITDKNVKAQEENIMNKPQVFSQSMIDTLNKVFGEHPQIIKEKTNYIDVMALMTRYQARIDSIIKLNTENKDNLPGSPNIDTMQRFIYGMINDSKDSFWGKTNKYLYLNNNDTRSMSKNLLKDRRQGEYTNPYGQKVEFKVDIPKKEEENKEKKEEEKKKEEEMGWMDEIYATANAIGQFITKIAPIGSKDFQNFTQTFDATSRGAVNQVVFWVDHTGSTSESFSNSVGEMDTGGKIKSLQTNLRQQQFNFSGGQTGLGVLDSVINGIKDVANNVIDHVSFGFSNIVRGFLSGGYVDVPKIWQDSDCTFPTMTYTMELVAPYGNIISRLQNIVIPLSMVLAGALPLRVGKAAYTSPFLCSCFSKSIHHIRLGMITDVSITRGTSNLAYTMSKNVNAIQVSFTVTDFSHKIAAPMNVSIFSDYTLAVEEGTPWADYVDALGGKDYFELVWMFNKIQNRFSDMFKDWYSYINPDMKAMIGGEFIWNSSLSMFFANSPAIAQGV